MSDGNPLATSLQNSVLAMRRNAASDIEAHPFFRGPFVLANDGGSTALD